MRGLITSLFFVSIVPPLIGISTPSAGAVLRGIVNITGDNQVPSGSFAYSEVAFSYAGDPTGTWFLIATNTTAIQGATLATWDTTTITDGDYSLRLRVYSQDGTTIDVTVTDLHVRNDTAPATATPPVPAEDIPTLAASVPTATLAPVPVTPAFSRPTAGPDNPASLTDNLVVTTFRRGAVFAVIAFMLIGLFLRFRTAR